jgi:serine/threonine protein kinase
VIGQTLSHYKILSEISRGGMGIVYRVLDLKLDREVALKALPPELVAGSKRKRRNDGLPTNRHSNMEFFLCPEKK